MGERIVHPSNVCWSCRSANVNSTDHDGHGAAVHLKPESVGQWTARCLDCGAEWVGQLRRTVPPKAALTESEADHG